MPATRLHVVDTLDAVPAAGWDRLDGARNLYLSHAFLRFVERETEGRVAYVCARRGRELVGALPLYDGAREPSPYYRPSELLGGRWRGDGWRLAGARRAYANELLLASGLDADERRDVLSALVAAAAEVPMGGGAGTALLYLSTAAAQELQAVVPAARPLLLDVAFALDVPAGGIDAYVASLPHGRRTAVRRERRAFAAAGHVVAREPLRDCWAEAAPLLHAVQRKYGAAQPLAHWRGKLAAQLEALEPHAVVLTCRNRGGLVAFVLFYRWRGSWYARLHGIDGERAGGAFEYFNLAYYEAVRLAAAEGVRRLDLGVDALEAKVRRGATAQPRWAVTVPGRPSAVDDADWRAHNAARCERLRLAGAAVPAPPPAWVA